MKIIVLASGSKGNATYIETARMKILIDAGISMLQIRNRLAVQGITFDSLDAVFVTHEHTDHIQYLASILARTGAVLYIHPATFEAANQRQRGALTPFAKVYLVEDTKYVLEDLVVVPTRLSHDAANIFGYLVKQLHTSKNITFASITDTGYIPLKYLEILSTIKVLLIESNHDVEMLLHSKRSWPLIQRILSDQGHMSNMLCTEILTKIVSKHMEYVILGHLSEECNEPELAKTVCVQAFGGMTPFQLLVARQYESLPVIEIS